MALGIKEAWDGRVPGCFGGGTRRLSGVVGGAGSEGGRGAGGGPGERVTTREVSGWARVEIWPRRREADGGIGRGALDGDLGQ